MNGQLYALPSASPKARRLTHLLNQPSNRPFRLYMSCHPIPWPLLLRNPKPTIYLNLNLNLNLIPTTHLFLSLLLSLSTNLFTSPSMAPNTQSYFEDLLPTMADKLGGEGLIEELCNGFRLLMDGDKGVITFDSLKKNAALLGLQELREDDLRGMLREGDFDGDGALNQMEFCVLMFKLSPELMEHSQFLLQEALQQELTDLY